MLCSICEEPILSKEEIAEVIDGEPVCIDCFEDDDDEDDDDGEDDGVLIDEEDDDE